MDQFVPTCHSSSSSSSVRAMHLINRFVKQLRHTLHICLRMTPAIMFSKNLVMPLFSSFPPLSQIYIPHTHTHTRPDISTLSVFSTHRCITCAYQCCLSAWFSRSSAWMHSYQIKLALTDSDLPAPPQQIPPHTRIPGVLSLFTSTSPSFDISAPSVILEVPLSAVVVQWHKRGGPKVPAGPYVYIHKAPEYFLILQRHIAMLSVRRIVWISLQHDYHNRLRCRFCSDSPVFIRLYAGCENHLKYMRSFLPFSWVYCMFHLYLLWPQLCKKKKKKLNKVSFYFSVIYSARILGELIFFYLFFSHFPSSLFLCERAELCVRSVGCL